MINDNIESGEILAAQLPLAAQTYAGVPIPTPSTCIKYTKVDGGLFSNW